MNMIATSIERLQYLCHAIPPLLEGIDEETFSHKPAPDKWSKKEILGHLIDSAANNHHRFVRGQFQSVPSISYDQNEWNRCSRYNRLDSAQLIAFWTAYNRHLAAIGALIPEEDLLRTCNTGGAEDHTLAYLFDDYVVHLEHHLRQIFEDY
jgi:hypothetical protein